jgi:hypothetical protein
MVQDSGREKEDTVLQKLDDQRVPLLPAVILHGHVTNINSGSRAHLMHRRAQNTSLSILLVNFTPDASQSSQNSSWEA